MQKVEVQIDRKNNTENIVNKRKYNGDENFKEERIEMHEFLRQNKIENRRDPSQRIYK